MIGFIIGLILGFFFGINIANFSKEDFHKLPQPLKHWIIKKTVKG